MSFNRLNRAQIIEEEGKIILGLFQNKIEEDVEDLFFEFRGLIIKDAGGVRFCWGAI